MLLLWRWEALPVGCPGLGPLHDSEVAPAHPTLHGWKDELFSRGMLSHEWTSPGRKRPAGQERHSSVNWRATSPAGEGAGSLQV
jgi:hypothetical protein